jgi:hypothetical protein
MAGFFQNLLGDNFLGDTAKGFFGNDYLRDFQHASKTFRSNGYAYSPKFKFLFHVYFEINKDLIGPQANLPQDSVIGLAVKTVQLPSFTIATANMNQYNRKRVVQTKINYDDVNITFHDDNASLIRNLWYRYYTYYYKDATKIVSQNSLNTTNNQPSFNTESSPFDYNRRNIYDNSLVGDTDWGYVGETNQDQSTPLALATGASKPPFFKSIRIYGFNQHNFSMCELINPTITAFKHDTYSYSESNGTMENTMTVAYETVKYAEGAVDGKAILSGGTSKDANAVADDFGKYYYDKTISPISRPGANQTILGQGGLIDAAGGIVGDLTSGNILGAIATAGRSYNTFKNTNLKTVVAGDIKTIATGAISSISNRNNPFAFPALQTSVNNTIAKVVGNESTIIKPNQQ